MKSGVFVLAAVFILVLSTGFVNLIAQGSGGGESGDAFLIRGLGDNINLGDTWGVFTGTIDGDDLKVLADGTYVADDSGEFDYEQKIAIGSPTLTHFRDSDYEELVGLDERTPVLGFKISSGTYIMNYTLDFVQDAESTVTSGHLDDLEGTNLHILGKTYYVVDAKSGTADHVGKLTLLDNAITSSVKEGSSTTVNVGDKFYAVSISFIDNDEVVFDINGERAPSSGKLNIGDSFRLNDNSYLGVRDINKLEIAGEVGSASFSMGSGKLELTHGNDIKLNDVTINGIKAYMPKGNSTSLDEKLDKIVIQWKTDEEVFLTEDLNLEMPAFDHIGFTMDLVRNDEERITIQPDGDNSLEMTVPIKDGMVSFNLLYGSNGKFTGLGKASDERLATSSNSLLTFHDKDSDGNDQDTWFVASYSDNCNSADVDRDGTVEVEDLKEYINKFQSDCRNIWDRDLALISDAWNDPNFDKICTANNNLCELLDINGDGGFALSDVLVLSDILVGCTGGGGTGGNPNIDSNADLNEDGYVNYLDREIFLTALSDNPVGTNCDRLNSGESYLLRARVTQDTSNGRNETTIDKNVDGTWVEVCGERTIGDTCDIGKVSMTVASVYYVSGREESVTFRAGLGVSFNKLFTKNGLTVYLPDDLTVYLPDEGDYNGSSYELLLAEEDKNDELEKNQFGVVLNSMTGGDKFQAGPVFQGDLELSYLEKGDSSGIYESYIRGDVATRALHYTKPDEDYVEIYYPGKDSETYAEVYLAGSVVEDPVSVDCRDPDDGGDNIYKKGTILFGNSPQPAERCFEGKVQEYWCKDNQVTNQLRDCPNGCKDGACIKGRDIELSKGWNLVPFIGLLTDPLEDISEKEYRGLFLDNNIRAAFVFNPLYQKYKKLHKLFSNKDVINAILDFIGWKHRYMQLNKQSLFHTSYWVYSSSDQTISIPVENDYLLVLEDTELYSGWNFLTISEDMMGMSMNEWTGDCRVVKAAIWSSDQQGWDIAEPQDYYQEFDESMFGKGLVLNVVGNCELGGNIAPPPLPSQ